MPRGVLFDLDNTLTDRRGCVERFARPFVEAWGSRLEPIEPAALCAALIAADRGGYNPRRAEDLLERLPWRAAPTAPALEAHWQAQFPFATVLRGGVVPVLERLRDAGFRLGVVTNGEELGQNAKIDHAGLRELLPVVVTSGGVGCKKPDRRIFGVALERLGVEAADSWFVGDHPVNDVQGAEAAGMAGVWIRDGHRWPAGAPLPERTIAGFEELPALLGTGS